MRLATIAVSAAWGAIIGCSGLSPWLALILPALLVARECVFPVFAAGGAR